MVPRDANMSADRIRVDGRIKPGVGTGPPPLLPNPQAIGRLLVKARFSASDGVLELLQLVLGVKQVVNREEQVLGIVLTAQVQ